MSNRNGRDLPPVPFANDELGTGDFNPSASYAAPQYGGLSTVSGFIPQAPTVRRGGIGAARASGAIGGARSTSAVYSGLTGSGYTLKGNPARFLLPQTDVLSSEAAISGKLDNWPANVSSNLSGASRALRYRRRKDKKTPRAGGTARDGKEAVPGASVSSILGKNNRGNNSTVVSGAKPRFLKQIEHFIESELMAIGATSEGGEPSAARLQVFREAFQYVIDDFKTYKPLLAAIKNEYDMLLDKYARSLHYIPPLKARLSTAKADTQQRLEHQQGQHEKEMKRLNDMVELLEKNNAEMKALNKTLTQDNLKITQGLDEQRAKYLDMKTANLSLIESVKSKDAIIVDEKMKVSQQTDRSKYLAMQLEQSELKYDTSKAEVKKLRAKLEEVVASAKEPEITPAQMLAVQKELKKSRDDLDKASKEFKKIQAKHAKLASAAENLTAKNKTLETKLKEAEDSNAKAIASRSQLNRMEDAGIPLPQVSMHNAVAAAQTAMSRKRNAESGAGEQAPEHVDRSIHECLMACLHHIDHQGLEDIDHGDNAASKPESLVVLSGLGISTEAPGEGTAYTHLDVPEGAVKSVVHSAKSAKDLGMSKDTQRVKDANAYFVGKGVGDAVPLYLRGNGRVKNLFLNKREVEQFIKTCWIQKGRKRYTKTLEEFMYVFLCEKYPRSPAERLEFGYSLLYALDKYNYDADCDLFQKVLLKELPEEVFLSQGRLIRKIQESCIRDDRKDGDQSGRLRKTQIIAIVRKLCPTKSAESFKEIEQALFFDTQLSSVDYLKLFQEDEEGDQGKFVECLRDQYLDECFLFREQIQSALDILQMNAADVGKAVTFSDVRRALKTIAPEKTPEEISTYITQGSGTINSLGGGGSSTDSSLLVETDPDIMASDLPMEADAVNVDEFLTNLSQYLLHR